MGKRNLYWARDNFLILLVVAFTFILAIAIAVQMVEAAQITALFTDYFSGADGTSPDPDKWDIQVIYPSEAISATTVEIVGNRLSTSVGADRDTARDPKVRNELRAKYLADWSYQTVSYRIDVNLFSEKPYQELAWTIAPTVPPEGVSVCNERTYLYIKYEEGAFEAWVMRNGLWTPNVALGRYVYTGSEDWLETVEIQVTPEYFRVCKNWRTIIPWTKHGIPNFTQGYFYLHNASGNPELLTHTWDNIYIQHDTDVPPTATPIPTSTATPTATPTGGTSTPTATNTSTATPSATSTSTKTPTNTPTRTPTPTRTYTPTSTSTATPTATFTPDATRTAAALPTITSTPTATPEPQVRFTAYLPLVLNNTR